jgi:hypothetical protein
MVVQPMVALNYPLMAIVLHFGWQILPFSFLLVQSFGRGHARPAQKYLTLKCKIYWPATMLPKPQR